jgi:hypothetical protein
MRLGLGLNVSPTVPPPDEVTPTFVSGTCGPEPHTITLTFSEPMTWVGPLAGIWGDNDSNVFTIPGFDGTLSYVSGQQTRIIVMTLDQGIASGTLVQIAYQTSNAIPPGNPGNMTDLAGNILAAFDPTAITNLVP